MKTMKKIFAVCLALMMTVSCIPSVYAADRVAAPPEPVDPALIDEAKVGSLLPPHLKQVTSTSALGSVNGK